MTTIIREDFRLWQCESVSLLHLTVSLSVGTVEASCSDVIGRKPKFSIAGVGPGKGEKKNLSERRTFCECGSRSRQKQHFFWSRAEGETLLLATYCLLYVLYFAEVETGFCVCFLVKKNKKEREEVER